MRLVKKAVKQALSLPNQTILYVAPTINSAIFSLKQIKNGKINKSNSVVVFENGSKIYFSGFCNPDKLRGLKLHAAFIEEGYNKDLVDIVGVCLLK